MKTQMLNLKNRPIFYVVFAIFMMLVSGLFIFVLGTIPEQDNFLLESCRQLGVGLALLCIAHFGLEYDYFLSLITKKCRNQLCALFFFFFCLLLACIGTISFCALIVTIFSDPLLFIATFSTILTLHFCGYDMTLI